MDANIAVMAAPLLQRVAWLAARITHPLAGMRLIRALAVRCATDRTALMHVCTALHLNNDFFTLHRLLHCMLHPFDLFVLFGEAQRAYGTRVTCDVSYQGLLHCVHVVNMYRDCVYHVADGVVTCIHETVTWSVAPPHLLHILQPRPVMPPIEELTHLAAFNALHAVSTPHFTPRIKPPHLTLKLGVVSLLQPRVLRAGEAGVCCK